MSIMSHLPSRRRQPPLWLCGDSITPSSARSRSCGLALLRVGFVLIEALCPLRGQRRVHAMAGTSALPPAVQSAQLLGRQFGVLGQLRFDDVVRGGLVAGDDEVHKLAPLLFYFAT